MKASIVYEKDSANHNLKRTPPFAATVDVLTEESPDWPLYHNDVIIRVLTDNPVDGGELTILLGFDQIELEPLINALMRGI